MGGKAQAIVSNNTLYELSDITNFFLSCSTHLSTKQNYSASKSLVLPYRDQLKGCLLKLDYSYIFGIKASFKVITNPIEMSKATTSQGVYLYYSGCHKRIGKQAATETLFCNGKSVLKIEKNLISNRQHIKSIYPFKQKGTKLPLELVKWMNNGEKNNKILYANISTNPTVYLTSTANNLSVLNLRLGISSAPEKAANNNVKLMFPQQAKNVSLEGDTKSEISQSYVFIKVDNSLRKYVNNLDRSSFVSFKKMDQNIRNLASYALMANNIRVVNFVASE